VEVNEEIVSRRRQERHAVREMRVDPSEPPCRGRYQTAISCCGPMVVVVNVMVKRRGIRSRHVGMREPSASELLKTHRYPFKRRQNRGCLLVPGKAWWKPTYRPCGVRCIGSGNLIRAFVRNLRTWWAMVTEKAQTAKTVRPKVRMRPPGADYSVVAKKQGNSCGAKGVGHLHQDQPGQRATGRTRGFWWEAAAFTGWHEPDKSRGLRPVL
jgi:hypothetical protein